MEKKQRIEWIDISKAIGIILVVLGHVTQNKILFNIIYSFHMPMFFIISGFTYCYENKKNFYKKNAKSLMIPFYIFGLISYLYWFFIERNFRKQEVLAMKPLINLIMFNGGNEYFIENVALWFLPCIFFVKSIVYFFETKLKKISKFKKIIALFIVVFALLSWFVYKECNITLFYMLERLGVYIFFFGSGILINKMEIMNLLEKKNSRFINLMIFIIFTIINLKIDNLLINLISYFALAFSGSFIVFRISQMLNFECLKFIGKNTLLILCIHEPIKRVLLKLMGILLTCETDLLRNNIIVSYVATLILFLIFVPIILVVNKFFPFVLGKKRREKNEK